MGFSDMPKIHRGTNWEECHGMLTLTVSGLICAQTASYSSLRSLFADPREALQLIAVLAKTALEARRSLHFWLAVTTSMA